jgi:hypothetical protein
MATFHRAAAGSRNILHQQSRQTGSRGFLSEPLQVSDRLRCAPERAAIGMDGLETKTLGRQADGTGDAAAGAGAANNMQRARYRTIGTRRHRCHRKERGNAPKNQNLRS